MKAHDLISVSIQKKKREQINVLRYFADSTLSRSISFSAICTEIIFPKDIIKEY